MTEQKNSNSFNTLAVLGILFIALKLCGVIDWSWLWVLVPFWATCALYLLAFIVGLVWSVISSYRK